MNELTVYHYPRCGTCRKAVSWLEQNGIPFTTIPIVSQPPTKEQMQQFVRQSEQETKKFFNTSGRRYRELNLKEKLPQLSEDEKLSLLASDGMLIKRPIVTDGKRVTVGFREEEFAQVWGRE